MTKAIKTLRLNYEREKVNATRPILDFINFLIKAHF